MAADRTPIDFVALAAALLDRAPQLLSEWLPGGVERNGRWYVGDFDGADGESANVNLRTGQWIDNAAPDEDCGGDFISLYRRLNNLAGNADAARALMRDYPHLLNKAALAAPAPPAPPVPAAEAAARTAEGRWVSVLPVPAHAPEPAAWRFGFKDKTTTPPRWVELEATQVWPYVLDGQRFGYVTRFERINSKGELVKDTVPRTWCQDTQDEHAGQRWHWKQWSAPRPLYVPRQAFSTDGRAVVVVEGEKCALAGHQLLGDEFDFVCWPGGCKAWALASWPWLQCRTVYLWPDADSVRQRLSAAEREAGVAEDSKPFMAAEKQPGLLAMVGIGRELQARQGCTVHLLHLPAPGTLQHGWDIADAVAEGWGAQRVRDYIRAAHPFVDPAEGAAGGAGGGVPPSTPTPASAGAGSGHGGPHWGDMLVLGRGKVPAPVRENVALVLDGLPERGIPGDPAAEGVVAYNEFTNDVVKLRATPWGTPAGVWDETDELELGHWLVRAHGLPSMPRGTLEEGVAMVAKRHRYHPVRAWLEGLRGGWDGTPRLRTWLQRCCVAEAGQKDAPAEYLARVGTWLVMAICARVLQPGIKFDYMVIFEGAQGVGKSTLARLLGGDWFADTGLVLGDKDSYQNLQGVLIYEWGELDALSKAEVTKVKQFISSLCDRFRASFDRRAKDYPRQVVFVGTTNEDAYLSDPTGNRRMWPVKVSRQVDLQWLRENLQQMFCEALVLVEQGQRFHPTPREQRELFEPEQQQRVVDNAVAAAVLRYLYEEEQHLSGTRANGALVTETSTHDLLAALNIAVDKQTAAVTRQANAALRGAGWLRVRSNKPPRTYLYRRPNPDTLARASLTLPEGTQPEGDHLDPVDAAPF